VQHPDFIAWMLLYPLTVTAAEVIQWRWGERRECSVEARGLAGLIYLVIWFVVGKALY